jgi:hypothetical protein
MEKIALPTPKAAFCIRHFPSPSDINPSMKYFVLLLAFLSLSCGGSGTSTAQTDQPKNNLTSNSTPQSSQQASAQSDPFPSIPKDAEWTILCATFSGPDHAATARAARTNLINQTKMHDWYILHGQGQTTLYYGFYRSINDPKDAKETARAQNDRKAIAALSDPASGARLFPAVILTKLDTPDPSSPPEWDLTRAQGTYALQIAVYKDSPDRRAAAVEVVRAARGQGYDAYYFHGPTASSVCIGAWPETAVRERNDFNVKTMENPAAVPLVTAGSLPTLAEGQQYMTPDGKPMNVVAAKYEILDPKLLAMMKQFPTHSVNGVERPVVYDPRTGQKRLAAPHPSFLVKIPRNTPIIAPSMTAIPDPNRPIAAQPAPQQQPAPAPAARPPTASQGGKLRSIDDR